MTTTSRRTTYAEVFAIREFRVVFGGNVVMVLSESMQILALTVFVFTATGSAFISVFAFSAGFLPEVVGGAFLLSYADRLPPRFAIVAGACARVVKLLLAAVPLPVPVMLAIVLGFSVVRPVFNAAASGLLPEILDGDRYVPGRSIFTVALSVAQIASLGGGGALLAWLGPRPVLYVAAAVAALGGLWSLLGLTPRPARGGRSGHGVLVSLRRNRDLLGNPRIRRLLLAFWLPVSLLTGAESLVVAYAGWRGFAASAGGVLLVAMPLGMLVGDLVVGRFLTPEARERATFPLTLLLGTALLPIALPVPMWLAFASFAVASTGVAYQLGLQRAFVDAVPGEMRGQGMGVLGTGLMAGQGIGALLVGGVAEVGTPGLAVLVSGLTVIVVALTTKGRNYVVT